MNWEIGIDMYTLLCIKWMSNKKLLYKKIKEKKKKKKKEIRFVVIRSGGWKEGELDEGGQRVQTYSCRINKY